MDHRRCFAVHHSVVHYNLAAVGLPNALMPKADTHNRHLAGEVLDYIDRQASFSWGAGPGGDEDAFWFIRFNLLDADLVVTMHQNVRFQFTQVLDKIEGKGIVVIEDQHHRRAKYSSGSVCPSSVLKFKLHIT